MPSSLSRETFPMRSAQNRTCRAATTGREGDADSRERIGRRNGAVGAVAMSTSANRRAIGTCAGDGHNATRAPR